MRVMGTGLPSLLVFVLAAITLCCFAEEQSVNPEINKHYENAVFDTWIRRFERPGREVYDKRQAIVHAVEIRPGMTVADIGAGTGLFTRLFSPRVGSGGKVYAVGITEEFIENIQRIAEEQELKNVETVLSTDKDVLLPDNTIDIAFVCVIPTITSNIR